MSGSNSVASTIGAATGNGTIVFSANAGGGPGGGPSSGITADDGDDLGSGDYETTYDPDYGDAASDGDTDYQFIGDP